MNQSDIKKSICQVGKRIYQSGFVAANDGNISVRISADRVIITPTGVSKGELTPDMLITVDLLANVLQGDLKPSSETKMHLAIYQQCDDINAVVHAHPPYATAFAASGKGLEKMILPEAVLTIGKVPLAPYATPTTNEVPNSIEKFLPDHNCVLLENHGALTWAKTLKQAHFSLETLEFNAKIMMLSQSIGGPNEISPVNINKLMEVKAKLGL